MLIKALGESGGTAAAARLIASRPREFSLKDIMTYENGELKDAIMAILFMKDVASGPVFGARA